MEERAAGRDSVCVCVFVHGWGFLIIMCVFLCASRRPPGNDRGGEVSVGVGKSDNHVPSRIKENTIAALTTDNSEMGPS